MNAIVETLPASWYHRAEIFERERTHIFARHWSYVGWANQLARKGQFVTTDIAGQAVVVVNAGEGRLKGFLNRCRHRAAPVCLQSEGHIEDFLCPYHAWRYTLDGELVAAPGFGDDFDRRHNGLMPVRVEIWRGLVFACLDDNAETLDRWMGELNHLVEGYPLVSAMEYATMRANSCAANWKNYSDNSAEGYHLGSVHPGLSASLVRHRTRVQAYHNGRFVGFDVAYKEEGAPANSDQPTPGLWIYKFPGLLMHYAAHSFNLEKITPIDARHSRMERWFWFRPEVAIAARNQSIEFSDRVMQEDIAICVRVQRNLEAGQDMSGYLSDQREPGTVGFQSWVREALQ